MDLRRGHIKQMVDTALTNQTAIPCHETTYEQDSRGEAICRGFFDLHAQQVTPLRLACAMKLIVEQD
jgi:hypothetical protein